MAQLVLPSQLPAGRRPMTAPTPKGGGARYALPAGVAERLRQLATRLEQLTGVRTRGIGEPGRLAGIYQWLLFKQGGKLAVDRFQRELDACDEEAERAQDEDGVRRTGHEIWVWKHHAELLDQLPSAIAALERRSALSGDIFGSSSSLLKLGAAVAIGAFFLSRGRR